MTVKKFAAVIACAAVLSACASNEQPTQVQAATWQISDVYVDPDMPSQVPAEVAGATTMTFGGRSANGFTGCSSFNGIVSFTQGENQAAAPEDADTVRFTDVEFSPIDEGQCVGKILYVHDALVHMLVEDTFTIRHSPDGSMRLVVRNNQPDPQGIHLVPLSTPAQ